VRYVGIDLSTETGFIILDDQGELINEEEITSENEDPQRMIDIVGQITNQIEKNDKIAIEGFSYGSRGRGVSFQFGIGYALRIELHKRNYDYIIVSPGQLKKYATGKGNTSKDNMVLPIYKKWNYSHDSDNVRDAYVLAQIAKSLNNKEGLFNYQKDVIKELKKQVHLR